MMLMCGVFWVFGRIKIMEHTDQGREGSTVKR